MRKDWFYHRTSNAKPVVEQYRRRGCERTGATTQTEKALNLSYNKIGSEGAKGLVLPPGLQELDLQCNNIGAEGAKELVLPPSVKEINTGSRSTNIFLLNKLAKPEHKYTAWNRYVPYLLEYELPLRKEICRGLMFGRTKNPIFQFLQSTYGSKHIRRMILSIPVCHCN